MLRHCFFLQSCRYISNECCCCCCSVSQSCLTLCDPRDCSTPSLPVPHHLPEFAQGHVNCIGNEVQSSHPLTPSSPSALNLFQDQGLFQWVICLLQRQKYWSFSFSISPSSEYSGLISLKIDWLDLAVQGTFRSFLQHHSSKASILWCCLLYSPALTTINDHWEDHSLDCTDLWWQSNVSAFQYTV